MLIQFSQNGGDAAAAIDIFEYAPYGWPAIPCRDRAPGRRDRSRRRSSKANPGFVGDGQSVQNGIGRAAHGQIQARGVVQRSSAGHEYRAAGGLFSTSAMIAGPICWMSSSRRGSMARMVPLPGSAIPSASMQAVHAVGREHAGTTAAAGTAVVLQVLQFAPQPLCRRAPRRRPQIPRSGRWFRLWRSPRLSWVRRR